MTSILLVDDHPVMRRGLGMIIGDETDLNVTHEAGSSEEALDLIEKTRPDLVVADISLPGMSGIELTKHLQTVYPDLPVLIVSRHDETLYAERALRAGAKGYVMKLEASDTIVTAIRRVLRGGIYVSPEVNDRLLNHVAGGRASATASPLELLSDRELDVFRMTGQGQTTREIAERLHLSVKTVESYRARIKTKLGIANASELMQRAVTWVETESGGSAE
jgi:DNA-binding NarL/FixJ family response regulator